MDIGEHVEACQHESLCVPISRARPGNFPASHPPYCGKLEVGSVAAVRDRLSIYKGTSGLVPPLHNEEWHRMKRWYKSLANRVPPTS